MSRRTKPAAGGHSSSERWLITYSDLVTLLFALFIVLFASAEPSGEKFAMTAASIREAFSVGIFAGDATPPSIFAGGGGITPTLGQMAAADYQVLSEELAGATLELGVFDQVHVRLSDDAVIVSLSSNLLFGPARATVNPQAEPVLDRIAELLRTVPNAIRVEGHTDDIPVTGGAYATNWELSTARATAVLRYLVEQGGVTPDRIHAAGFAEFEPIADNSTPDGRAQNRRADVVILYPGGRNGAAGGEGR